MGFFIPQAMKNINNWVVWKKEGQGYIKKVPYDPRTGQRTDPTKSCCCFEDAITFYKYGDSFDGIGFCFTKDCGMTFIDIDNCINENDEKSPLAKELINIFSDCYIEYSQSLQGLHIICLGTILKTIKTKEIEIYSSGRYVALTGNCIATNEPQIAQKRLDVLFDRYTHQDVKLAPNGPKTANMKMINLKVQKNLKHLADLNSVIQIIVKSKQGPKWQNLHCGNFYGYPSTSEAAQAYIAITNYFAGEDEKVVKNIFLKSAFPKVNPKYQQDYYIDRMIKNAKNTLIKNHLPKKIIVKKQSVVTSNQKRKRF